MQQQQQQHAPPDTAAALSEGLNGHKISIVFTAIPPKGATNSTVMSRLLFEILFLLQTSPASFILSQYPPELKAREFLCRTLKNRRLPRAGRASGPAPVIKTWSIWCSQKRIGGSRAPPILGEGDET
jgi:hypothetical protein